MNKTCSICKLKKDFSSFNKKEQGFQPYCKLCQKIVRREWYLKNKAQHARNISIQKSKIKKEFQKLKENKPCSDCHKIYPHYVMDWDHRENKVDNVSTLVAKGQKTKALIEIDKCDLVCSNCHRIRTHQRRITGL